MALPLEEKKKSKDMLLKGPLPKSLFQCLSHWHLRVYFRECF